MTIARLSLGLGLLALLIGFSPNISLAAQANVTMGPNYFSPGNITVNVGDSVVWTNTDTMAHTVTSNTNAFNSGTMQPSATYSQTFNTPGTYQYYCAFHSGMVGTITVLAASQSPLPTSSTITDLQAQIQALLLRVQQLQQQTGGSGSAPAVPVPGAPVIDSSACPLIGRILYIGSTGDDVSRLQSFLARDASIYPERLVSGYYGPLTEAAVKRWQVKYNIVSSGTAATTGYGQVGPRTAAAMSLQCSTMSGGGAPNVGGFIRVTPISGNAPLAVSVEATVNTVNSCAGAVYTVDYGDGTGTTQITVPPGRCTQLVQTLSHIYQVPGTYNVGLSSGPHRTVATVIVTGTTQPTPTTPTPIPDSISANPKSGQAPVSVTFSGTLNGSRACGSGTYTVDFGDGQNTSLSYPDSCQAQSYSATHQYTQGGTFTAKLHRGSLSGTLATSTVVTITAPAVELGPFVVTPGIGGNPRTVEIEFDIATPCAAYDLDWGDGSAHVTQTQSTGSCAQVVTDKTFTHTYSQAGSYTIKLIRATRTDTASITITSF